LALSIERERPRLILLDLRMPHMDGWELARELRARRAAIPIVVVTAAQNARQWAEDVGAEAYLAKPFDLEELLAIVQRYYSEGNPPAE
jgi:CheY-like chemotaxis protein